MGRPHDLLRVGWALALAFGCRSRGEPSPALPPRPAPARPAAASASPSSAPGAAAVAAQTSASPEVDEPAPAPAPAVDERGCVRDLGADAARRAIEEHGAQIAKEVGRLPSLESITKCASATELDDLDGDGAPDADVTVCIEQGIHAWEHFLYFSNHGCPRFADHLVNAPLQVRRDKHHGVADLEATWAGGCAGNDFGWYHFAWTGHAYRVIDRASCHLCDDGEPRRAGENTHWMCQATLRARRAAPP